MNNFLDKTKLFFKRNSSTILTCIGAAGVVATAVMSAKATPKAMKLLEKAKEEKREELTAAEKIRIAGPAYVPSILMGTSTIACIFGANILNKRHQATLTSAYALLDNSYKEYRRKVKELHGEEEHKKIVNGIADERIENVDLSNATPNKQTFFDFFSLINFESTIEDICHAEYILNKTLNARGYVLLSEFYEMLGVECGDIDYNIGWSKASGCERISFVIEQRAKDESGTYYTLEMSTEPTLNFMY